MEIKEDSSNGVLTKLERFMEEIYPAVPRPRTVDISCGEEIYPNVPNPKVVDVRFVEVTSPEPPVTLDMYPSVPNPLTVEIRDDSRSEVLTKFERLTEER